MTRPKKDRPPQPEIDWKQVEAEWRAGGSNKAISASMGGRPTAQAIGQRQRKEGWARVDGTDPVIQQGAVREADKATVARTGEVLSPIPEEPNEPGQLTTREMHAAIMRRAQVLDRHRRELNLPRQRIYAALQESDFNKAKLAKISMETFSILQAAERKAWGLDGDPTIVFRVTPPSPRDDRE